MSQKSDKVKSGYAELDYSEKEEVKRFIEEFEKATIDKRKLLSENLKKGMNRSLGPIMGNTCPCCGKS